jgi:hypothetical protein
MLQDPNVERYVANAVKPLKKEIEQMKAQIEALNQALRIHDVVGRSEQLVCSCGSRLVKTTGGYHCGNAKCST